MANNHTNDQGIASTGSESGNRQAPSAIKKNTGRNSGRRLVIITCCLDDWGGSEELWARSIPILLKNHRDIILLKQRINFDHPEFVSLASMGIHLREMVPLKSFPQRMLEKFARLPRRIYAKCNRNYHLEDGIIERLRRFLKSDRPDLVLISQGINFDGLIYARECLRLNIPYVLVTQKAVDFYWPQPGERAYMTECYKKAQRCFFVSKHNRNLTEEQFGIRLTNSCIISNPVKIPVKPIPFPSAQPVYKLACVARLFVIDKGQDILLRILSRTRWRNRPVAVSFVGTGVDEDGLRAMASLLDLKNVEFTGQAADIEKVWREHHALILPSRSEGLPLSVVEAMAAGRPVIVSRAGGNEEIVVDNTHGFVGDADERSFEEAMERAWQRRLEWEQMGKEASKHIATHWPASPETEFAQRINNILDEK